MEISMIGLAGKTLDRYVLGQRVGKGGMADVYLGYDPYFQRAVAIKIFKHDNDNMLQRFMREAKIMAALRHPHLMPIYDTGESEVDGLTRYYIVMPFIDGGTLGMRIRHSPLSPEEASGYLLDIATALDYIHQHGIIHRDIKSTNVLLSTDDLCYLSDLGVARMLHDVYTLTSTGNVLGTVDYIAPELFVGNNKADARSDIYSLGILLFEMMTGQRPFSAENQVALASMHINDAPPLARTLVPSLSPSVEHVLAEALEKDPARRFPTATAMADAFYRATKMQHRTLSASQANSETHDQQTLASNIVVSDQLPAKKTGPVPTDLNVSADHHIDKKTGQLLASVPLSPPLVPTRARTKTSVLIALLFVIAILLAWVLGQMHTTAPTIIIRPGGAGITTKTSTFTVGTATSEAIVVPNSTSSAATQVPSLSSTPAVLLSPLPTSSPTPQPSQANLIHDPDYELQTTSLVTLPWNSVGTARVELNTRKARSGQNDARIVTSADYTWSDVRQDVNVAPNTNYTLSVYVYTSSNLNTNLAVFDVVGIHGSNINQVHFSPSPSGYSLISLTFNSASYNAVMVQIGFSGMKNTWVRVDDWDLHS
jgi:eukaryotic-like serine/threonine-protein kinase